MAAPSKTGLDYFSFDVDFFQDEKIQFVSVRFGLKGELVTIRLLCKIYRQGYYINWNKDVALLFAKSVGDNCQYSFVNDLVNELLKRGFFDRGIFERFSILTSAGIQSRYFEACLRRKEVYYNNDLLLIDVSKYPNAKQIKEKETNSEENAEPELNGVNVYINSQSKGNESKGNESKRNEESTTPAAALKQKQPKHKYGEYNNVSLTDKEKQKLIDEYGEEMAQQAIKFLDEYVEMKGYKHKSSYLAIRKWVINAVKEEMQKNQQQSKFYQQPQPQKQNRFVNYEQRKWDFEKMERLEMELLQKELQEKRGKQVSNL